MKKEYITPNCVEIGNLVVDTKASSIGDNNDGVLPEDSFDTFS